MIPMFMALFSQLIIHLYSNFEANFEKRILQLSDYDNPITTMPNETQGSTTLKDVYEEYKNLSGSVQTYDNISAGLLTMGDEHLGDYRKDYVIGGNFEHIPSFSIPITENFSIPIPDVNSLTALYNSIPKHSKPLKLRKFEEMLSSCS